MPRTMPRSQKYPWDDLLDGEVHAVPLDSLPVLVESFRAAARAAARTRRLRVTVKTAVYDDTEVALIQAFGGHLGTPKPRI